MRKPESSDGKKCGKAKGGTGTEEQECPGLIKVNIKDSLIRQ